MPKKDGFKTFYALSLAWQLGFLIALTIVGFLVLGLWADKFFETEPFLVIFGLIIGIIITAYEVYHLFIPLIKDDAHGDFSESQDENLNKRNDSKKSRSKKNDQH